MQLLTIDEQSQISGGSQNLSITTQISFDGIPESCVASYYQANQADPSRFNVDELGWNIIRQCPDFDNVSNISYSMDLVPVSMALVTF
jgi:hypothetical protein